MSAVEPVRCPTWMPHHDFLPVVSATTGEPLPWCGECGAFPPDFADDATAPSAEKVTDLAKLQALLDSWGVHSELSQYAPIKWVDGEREYQPMRITLEVCQHGQSEPEKVSGYTGFFTRFEFTLTEEFICMGAWE